MVKVTVDANGVLAIDGRKIFPIGLSEPPPIGATYLGNPALRELARNGVTFVRTGPREFGNLSAPVWGPPEWELANLPAQVAKVKQRFDEADQNGIYCWLYLANASGVSAPGSNSEKLLQGIVDAFKDNPRLLAYKGWDEPNNSQKPHGPLDLAYSTIKTRDPNHPVVIVEAPVGDLARMLPYGNAFDVTGVDVFPVEYPRPGQQPHPKPLTVVGDWTRTAVQAAQQSHTHSPAVWMTLQIASSGTAASHSKPNLIPRFPTLHDERFMAYHAIVRGARGLTFFGGHLTQVCSPDDAAHGWNWAFWRQVVRPIVHQLASKDLQPALTAPNAPDQIKTRLPGTSTATGVELVARRAGGFLYVIAANTGASGLKWIELAGLPAGTATGEVLFEYVRQHPPPPWDPPQQVPRQVEVTNGAFQDVFAPYDAHVYRFALP
jgi:hypothetical protein